MGHCSAIVISRKNVMGLGCISGPHHYFWQEFSDCFDVLFHDCGCRHFQENTLLHLKLHSRLIPQGFDSLYYSVILAVNSNLPTACHGGEKPFPPLLNSLTRAWHPTPALTSVPNTRPCLKYPFSTPISNPNTQPSDWKASDIFSIAYA